MEDNAFQIEVADEQSRSFRADRLIQMVKTILIAEGLRSCEVSIGVVDDQAMRAQNKLWLSHDYETDVLSFLLEYREDDQFLSGQLIVSTDTACRVAEDLGIEMEDELLLYVAHGTLHLVGYDDHGPEELAAMVSAEKRYLEQVGIAHVGRNGVTE